jgi:probable F420-dependent oxidoreductase
MHLGVFSFATEYAWHPAELARAAEERGLESLWYAEHSHIPVHRTSPWPGGPVIPKVYYDAMDPFVALAVAAAGTARLRLGTGICLVVQRDPIQTAKAVASLDQLSGGRLLFGVGGGWNLEEIANHGTDPARRFAVLRERIEAMKAIWTREEAEYHGRHVDFAPLVARPKPRQKPHPPVLVAGAFPQAARRAIRYGDGWLPLLGRDPDDVASLMPRYRAMAREAGRDPVSLPVSLFGCPPEARAVARYRDAGLARVVFGLPAAGRDELLPLLDRCAALAASAAA